MAALNNKTVESKRLKVKSGLQSGQSLIELLIAIGVAGIFITGAALSVDVALRSTSQNKQVQPAGQLAQELLDNVVVAARANWQTNIASLMLGSPYYVSVGVTTAGKEATPLLLLNGIQYQRFFVVSDLVSPDPLQKSITVTVEWPAASPTASITLTRFVARNQNFAFQQTDWSGGIGQPGFFVDATKFDTQSGAIKISEGGSMYLNGFSAP